MEHSRGIDFSGYNLTTARVDGKDDIAMAVLAQTISKLIGEDKTTEIARSLKAVEKNIAEGLILISQQADNHQGRSWPKVSGGSIRYPSIITRYIHDAGRFEHVPAIFSQEIYLNPIASLLHHNAGGIIKYAQDGACVYDRLVSAQESRLNDLVFEFPCIPSFSTEKRFAIKTEEIGSKRPDGSTIYYPNIFLTSWTGKSHEQQLVASYTRGSFVQTGRPIVRVQLTTNERRSDPETLHSVLSNMFTAAKREILERGWIRKGELTSSNFYELFLINAPKEKEVMEFLLDRMKAQSRNFDAYSADSEPGNLPNELFDVPLPRPEPFLTKTTKTSYYGQTREARL